MATPSELVAQQNDSHSDNEAVNSSASSSRSSSRSSSSQMDPIPHSSSYFHALNSPPGRRTLPSPITNEQETQRPSHSRSSYEVSLLDADSPRHSVRQVSASSAGRTHGSRLSEAVSESYGQWHRRTAPSAVSAHSSRPSNTSMTHQQSVPVDCNVDIAELGGRPVCNNTALPSCNYYVDNNGQMRIRKLWWCYMRIRRVLWCLFPWLKRDSNTYLCARMLANSTLIVVVYLLRELLNHVVVPAILKHKDAGAGDDAKRLCHDHSLEFLDMYAYSLVANVLLCLPALNFKACRLYRRARREYSTLSSTSSSDEPDVVAPSSSVADITKEHQRFEKTYLFTLCELIVVIEIPYLIYILVVMFVPSESGSVSELLADCNRQLATGYFVILIAIQLVAVLAYLLRWRQILFFHRLHQHFLFQRGYVPGHSRFDYIERSFATPLYAWLPAPLWACWSRFKKLRSAARAKRTGGQDGEYSVPSGSNKKQIHYVKVELYSAAKRGDVEQVRSLLETAVSISGPEFATEWYEPHVWKLGGLVLLARGKRNPLHVAVAFDQIEVVRELLANGHFDVQQFDKLELLRLDLAWVYRLWFRVLFFVVRRSSAGVVASASAGGGAGNGGAAPGLASASHPFGPVGLFQATLLTPLHVAVTLGHIELTLLLLRYGAKPDTSALSTHPRFATPPLYWAVDKECTRLLLDAGGNPLALPGDASGLLLTAFEVARIAGNAAVARQMEKYGGDVALTPLHDACASGRRHEVAFLLEHGADPDTLGEQVVGCFRRTPLHWAAMRGHARIIRLLVKYGGNVDARDVFGRTPLAWACVLNRTRAVETLLESGADVNVLDAQGDPLLCICAAGACASIKRGAKSSAGKRDKLGDDRVQEDNCDDAGYEEGPGVMLNGQRSLARGLDPQVFQLLLDYGVDLHATRTSNGDSALHVALRRRNQTAAVLFVRAGLSLTAVNLLGQRAIDCARSPALRFAVKKEAGQRDVMISYSHAHAPLARKIRDALERQRVTTWIDTMGPTGITGGSVWRQEIARGIQSSALVLAVLTKDYPQSQWCMKELAFAKMQNIPVVAIQCEDMEISEELQVYLWTRQVIDFRPAVKHNYGESIPYSLSEDKEEGAKERPMITSNSSHTMEDTDSREDDPGYRSDDDSNDMTNMMGKRVASSLELVPDYNDEAFCHCLRMLLDGIQDQIDEHRARLARRQEQQQQQVQLGRDPDGKTDGDASRHGSRRNDSECYPEEEEKGLCGIPSASGNPTECEDSDAQISFPEGPLNVPLFRPLRRIHSLASSLAFTSASDSFVFIAHGDFHRSFCMRLQKALLKQGIRCVVDQTVPAVQYAHQPQDHVDAEAQSSGFGTDVGGLDHPVARLPVQNRQLAAKDAIIACSAVLVVLSPLSANCDLLADQLAFAEDRGKLLVPILLSLHKVDLAKRYTFSRSMIQHFNISLGYEQSIEQLTNYLQAQQQTEARQRRLQRRQEDQGDLGVSLGAMAVLSPISSASSAQSRRSSLAAYTDVVQVQSPFDMDLLSTDSSLLLPTLPVRTFMASSSPGLNTSRTGSRVGSTSSGGHGWSEPDIVEAARHDDHLHNSFRHDRSRTASGVSNASARSRESSLRLTGSTRHHPNTAEDII